MSLLFNMLSRLVITFLPKSKCLLISWLQSPSAVIFYVLVIVCMVSGLIEAFPCHKSDAFTMGGKKTKTLENCVFHLR